MLDEDLLDKAAPLGHGGNDDEDGSLRLLLEGGGATAPYFPGYECFASALCGSGLAVVVAEQRRM